jgi:hypothetical protein
MRPYRDACGTNHHHSRQHTGRHVLQWPGEDEDRYREQRQQSGRMLCWPRIAVHFGSPSRSRTNSWRGTSFRSLNLHVLSAVLVAHSEKEWINRLPERHKRCVYHGHQDNHDRNDYGRNKPCLHQLHSTERSRWPAAVSRIKVAGRDADGWQVPSGSGCQRTSPTGLQVRSTVARRIGRDRR